mmetsp:Transcript_9938/g.22947  ORF Transcript_9938/g.22947 Transcript_9938/m.22947 type:complete len:153 (-) Transcript_9938:608-1066(-)
MVWCGLLARLQTADITRSKRVGVSPSQSQGHGSSERPRGSERAPATCCDGGRTRPLVLAETRPDAFQRKNVISVSHSDFVTQNAHILLTMLHVRLSCERATHSHSSRGDLQPSNRFHAFPRVFHTLLFHPQKSRVHHKKDNGIDVVVAQNPM